MPYWIHENGEVVGPLRAIEVLRRATPGLQVSDGNEWFRIDDVMDDGNGIPPDTDHGEPRSDQPRLTVR